MKKILFIFILSISLLSCKKETLKPVEQKEKEAIVITIEFNDGTVKKSIMLY